MTNERSLDSSLRELLSKEGDPFEHFANSTLRDDPEALEMLKILVGLKKSLDRVGNWERKDLEELAQTEPLPEGPAERALRALALAPPAAPVASDSPGAGAALAGGSNSSTQPRLMRSWGGWAAAAALLLLTLTLWRPLSSSDPIDPGGQGAGGSAGGDTPLGHGQASALSPVATVEQVQRFEFASDAFEDGVPIDGEIYAVIEVYDLTGAWGFEPRTSPPLRATSWTPPTAFLQALTARFRWSVSVYRGAAKPEHLGSSAPVEVELSSRE